MTKKQKNLIKRTIPGFIILCFAIIAEKTGLYGMISDGILRRLTEFVPVFTGFCIVGYDVIINSMKKIRYGKVFDEDFLMLTASVGAFAIGEYTEALAVMVFFQIGQLFESYAVGKSRDSIAKLMSINPEYAFVLREGCPVKTNPEEVTPGEILVVRPGDRIALDGIIREGDSYIDTSALTGESVLRHVNTGDNVISGCVNGAGTLKVEVTKPFSESTVSRILELVENASMRKAKTENFISRFAKYYTPVVTIGAVLLVVMGTLITGGDFGEWLRRGCTFLVISCPCALVISVPMGFFGGIGAASKIGVLIKGSSYIETFSKVRTMVFDKTGTLTKGEFKVQRIDTNGSVSRDMLMEIAAHAEYYSTHPIAIALREAYSGEYFEEEVENYREIAGKGISVDYRKRHYTVGNAKLFSGNGDYIGQSLLPGEDNGGMAGTVVYIAENDIVIGKIIVSDTLKEGVQGALTALKRNGIKRLVMLTGDRKNVAEDIAKEAGIDEIHAELLPGEKVEIIEKLIAGEAKNEKTAFVGDGINDAPVIMRSDLGIAMGALGSDAAIEAADIVLMDDDLTKLERARAICKKTLRIVRENIIVSLGVKLAVLILGALGLSGMWFAVFADVGVCVIAVSNSLRMLIGDNK